jgi:predicted RND superfamily exporter protein
MPFSSPSKIAKTMFQFLARFILKHRLALLIAVGLLTVLFGLQLPKLQLSYDFSKVVPANDPDLLYLQQFQAQYGQDGNTLVIGLKDSTLYTPLNFKRYSMLSEELRKIEGVEAVMSLPLVPKIVRNDSLKAFEPQLILQEYPQNQTELDSILGLIVEQRLFSSQLVNQGNGATIILVTISTEVVNSPRRLTVMEDIQRAAEQFTDVTGLNLHYAGLPYVRAVMTHKVQAELKLFLLLSVLVTAIILFYFFRSFRVVIISLAVIGVMIVWSLGTVVVLGYKITLLTGLIPPIIVVIGIPNCIYLLNKYHQEYRKTDNQLQALANIIQRIGFVTLITNFTTAVGFLVLTTTGISILKEFGLVAGLNIFATFVVSIILIPALFSYFPPPSPRHLNHLDRKNLGWVLNNLDYLVHRHRYRVIAGALILTALSAIGAWQVKAKSYMVDDIPEQSQVKTDLYFFEENFGGVMPLELVIDTGRPRGVMNLRTLRTLDSLQNYLATQPEISVPISVVNFLKASKQAFYGGNSQFYELPSNRERSFLIPYLRNKSELSGLQDSFLDSAGQQLRLSMKVQDLGSVETAKLLQERVIPHTDSLLAADSLLSARYTGTTVMFLKGNNYLIDNLRSSLVIAIVVIAFIMALLFRNIRMILISVLPNLVPLLFTAGLMGYLGIALKPSTALIFSIAFGIAVDDSIHFLAKYRMELVRENFFSAKAVSTSIRETGSSMIYTSIVLFFGFIIFAFSDFGGTVALGILTSSTLLVAMLTNLILLPALLLVFDHGKYEPDAWALLEDYDEFYLAPEDEEIDVNQLNRPT